MFSYLYLSSAFFMFHHCYVRRCKLTYSMQTVPKGPRVIPEGFDDE